MDLTSTSGVTAQPLQQVQKADEEQQQKQQPVQAPPVQSPAPQISSQAQQMLDTERNAGKKFDVQNLTPAKFEELRDELADSGLITPLEAEELTALFDEQQKSLSALQNDSEQPHNVLGMLQEQVETGDGSQTRFAGLFDVFSSLDAQQQTT